ncbi:MAG TPA: multicopper oxidase domain-containing protein [Gemmatimonadaceae bacterium]|nr:multicopper oxidase domain-containing protein [Gemmatimonadaceae bacterium]
MKRILRSTLAAALASAAALSLVACATDPVAPEPQSLTARSAVPLQTRTYYIAADLIVWDYAPSGMNLVSGEAFTPEESLFAEQDADKTRIGRRYTKALYREYTDESFTTLKPRPPEWQHLGALGPLIRAQVSDTIRIVFKNNADRPYSVHPHGVFYDKASEGAPYDDDDGVTTGDAVPPGATHTYIWPVPDRAGPGPADGSSVFWMYHSHVDEPKDANTGLIGPIIITGKGRANADASPKDVDREFINLFMIYDENSSWYLGENIEAAGVNLELADPEEFEESNLKHTINGFLWDNFPTIGNSHAMTMRMGDRVRWYLLGMGTEVDLHTPHWHGQTVLWMGMRTDVVELLPGTMRVVDMVPDNPGTWLYHCHVNDHITAGMLARFRVVP